MIPAAVVWVVTIFFPMLLADPVTVRVETASAEHCSRVRKLLISQLEAHRSNAVVGFCALAAPTVIPEPAK